MLIRLVSDGKNNPTHVDKLIAIDGLPKEWIFDARKDKESGEEILFLKAPWDTDITENIPLDIRIKFQPVPIEVWFETPMEIRPGTYQAPEMSFLQSFKKTHGFRLSMQTNQGEQMWNQIVDLLERETPRSQRIPQPAIVGDLRTWTLTADKVPHVKLTGDVLEVPKEQISVIPVKIEPRPNEYACRTCGDIFDKERGRWMHERKKHAVKDSFVPERKVAVA